MSKPYTPIYRKQMDDARRNSLAANYTSRESQKFPIQRTMTVEVRDYDCMTDYIWRLERRVAELEKEVRS